MSESSLQTTVLQGWLVRMRAGDLTVRDEMLRQIGGRLEHMARKMLKKFPNVKAWTETGDVVTGAVMRLLRTLEKVQPPTARDFFALAAVHIRRELLDLARYFAAERRGRTAGAMPLGDEGCGVVDPISVQDEGDQLDRWRRFHEEVEKLPVEEREVVGLIFYHGWKYADVAHLFQVTEKTVQRRWASAMTRLQRILGDS
jgi:RNA polymerase sigma factor (sigma-70 family)